MVRSFYLLKRAAVFPLRFTPFRPLANTKLPLRSLLHPKKITLLSACAPHTMCDYPKLSNTYDLACNIEQRALAGAFVECGTWKGGNAAVMASVASAHNSRRKTWYFDSFEGMPEPTEKDVADTKRGKIHARNHELAKAGFANASVSDVEELIFTKLGLAPEDNIIVKGWFKDTLPQQKREIGPIAILRLDGDWYESTMTALNELYDQVVVGGYVIVDDYGGWEGCRRAVHEFFSQQGTVPNIQLIGAYHPDLYKKIPPVYFRKGDACSDASLYRQLENTLR